MSHVSFSSLASCRSFCENKSHNEQLLTIEKRSTLTRFGHVVSWKDSLGNTILQKAQVAVDRKEDM